MVKNSFKNILKFYETKGKFNFYNVIYMMYLEQETKEIKFSDR